jgi:hypothetical protein
MPVKFSPSRQIAFHLLLIGARKKWLVDALKDAVARVNPRKLKAELARLVPPDVQQILAQAGIRDEFVFPVPSLLEEEPTLVGYYRLLLGVSQKRFYRTGTGMGVFRSMEMTGTLNERQRTELAVFCKTMIEALADLIRQVSPAVTPRDVAELPLLTLGAQFQGGNNVSIGKQATVDVFLAIAEIVGGHTTQRTEKRLVLTNASDRTVVIALAGDPDVRIQEEFDGALRNRVAIEIKGGTDVSNVHNRVGEAEKSHQKAKGQDYRDFWTIISLKGTDLPKLKSESPTTTSWFDASEVLARDGVSWEEFRSRIIGAVGIPAN